MSETLTDELLKSLARLPERFGELLASIGTVAQKVDLLNAAAEQRGLKAEQRADAMHESIIAMDRRTTALEEGQNKVRADLDIQQATLEEATRHIERLHAFKARAVLLGVALATALLVYELMAGGKLGQLMAKMIGVLL